MSEQMTTKKRSWSDYMPFVCGSLPFIWQLFFFYIPLCCVILASFSGESWYEGFMPFFTPVYGIIFLRSLGIAFLTAVLSLLIGYPIAYYIVFHAGRLKNMLLFLIMLPFWTNFLLHICAWFLVLDRKGFISSWLLRWGLIGEPLHIMNSWWAILLVMIYFYLPFTVLPLYAALERFDKRLLEASLDLGASWLQTVIRILLPLTISGIRVGFLLVLIPAFGEFVIPEFMGGDRTMYVGSVISHFILATESHVAGAGFTLLSSVGLMFTAGLFYWAIGLYGAHDTKSETT